jgi:hypothetical protein
MDAADFFLHSSFTIFFQSLSLPPWYFSLFTLFLLPSDRFHLKVTPKKMKIIKDEKQAGYVMMSEVPLYIWSTPSPGWNGGEGSTKKRSISY